VAAGFGGPALVGTVRLEEDFSRPKVTGKAYVRIVRVYAVSVALVPGCGRPYARGGETYGKVHQQERCRSEVDQDPDWLACSC
jgi:hypothetical protein